MEPVKRALQELRDWAVEQRGGMDIHFGGHHPAIINKIPHSWQCSVANGADQKEMYHGYGTSFEEAVLTCHDRWKNQIQGYAWQEVELYSYPMTPKEWFEFQQRKPLTEV